MMATRLDQLRLASGVARTVVIKSAASAEQSAGQPETGAGWPNAAPAVEHVLELSTALCPNWARSGRPAW
jgi:hypothetical protein